MTDIITDPQELNNLFGKKYKTKETHRNNMLEAYHNNKEKRLRQITLYNLNNGKCKQPSPRVIKQHDLKYDTVSKKWV